ncbi:flagellar motor switch protein FliM, partial [Escherichia coli 3006]
YPAAGKLA